MLYCCEYFNSNAVRKQDLKQDKCAIHCSVQNWLTESIVSKINEKIAYAKQFALKVHCSYFINQNKTLHIFKIRIWQYKQIDT